MNWCGQIGVKRAHFSHQKQKIIGGVVGKRLWNVGHDDDDEDLLLIAISSSETQPSGFWPGLETIKFKADLLFSMAEEDEKNQHICQLKHVNEEEATIMQHATERLRLLLVSKASCSSHSCSRFRSRPDLLPGLPPIHNQALCISNEALLHCHDVSMSRWRVKFRKCSWIIRL